MLTFTFKINFLLYLIYDGVICYVLDNRNINRNNGIQQDRKKDFFINKLNQSNYFNNFNPNKSILYVHIHDTFKDNYHTINNSDISTSFYTGKYKKPFENFNINALKFLESPIGLNLFFGELKIGNQVTLTTYQFKNTSLIQYCVDSDKFIVLNHQDTLISMSIQGLLLNSRSKNQFLQADLDELTLIILKYTSSNMNSRHKAFKSTIVLNNEKDTLDFKMKKTFFKFIECNKEMTGYNTLTNHSNIIKFIKQNQFLKDNSFIDRVKLYQQQNSAYIFINISDMIIPRLYKLFIIHH